MICKLLVVTNHHSHDRAVDCAIRRLINQVRIRILIEKILSNEKITRSFKQNPRSYIRKYCDKNTKRIRETIDSREENHNMRYQDDLVLIYKGK